MIVREAVHALWVALGVISALEFLNMRSSWLRRNHVYEFFTDWLPYGLIWVWIGWIDGVGNVVMPLYATLLCALHTPNRWNRKISLLGMMIPAVLYVIHERHFDTVESEILIGIAVGYVVFHNRVRASYWAYGCANIVATGFCVLHMTPVTFGTFEETLIVSIIFVLYEHDALIRARYKEERGLDPLTGLYNRRGAEEWLNLHEGNLGIAILVDLDDFKFINDFFGHDAGDEVLRKVGGLLVRFVSSPGIGVRWGGDEFLILAEHETTQSAEQFVEELFNQLSSLELSLNERRLCLRCSVGVAYGPLGDLLITEADRALLRVKQSGKAHVEWYHSANENQREQVDINQYAFQKAFHQLTEFCSAPCLATDLEFRIIDLNEAYERVSGYTRNALRGQKPSMLAFGDWNRRWYPEIHETLQRGRSWTGILHNQREDGTIWSGEMVISPVRIGEITAGYWCMVRRVFSGDKVRTELLNYEIQVDQDTAEYIENIFLQVLAEVAEWGDPELRAHVLRVRRYTNWLAAKLAERKLIDPRDVPILSSASIAHDIGKVAIAREILFKTNILDEVEHLYIQRHTEIGEQILQSVLDKLDDMHIQAKRVVECAKVIAGSHHEWWNGTGYPRGLRGNDIPLPGRLVAITDVLDALLSRRPYKEPWSFEEVRNYFESHRGLQFDPKMVTVLLEEWAAFEDLVKEVTLYEVRKS